MLERHPPGDDLGRDLGHLDGVCAERQKDRFDRSKPGELVAHHAGGRHDCRELEAEHRLGPVPPTLDGFRRMHSHLLVVRGAEREESGVVATPLARRRDEVPDVDELVRRHRQVVIREGTGDSASGEQFRTGRIDPRLDVAAAGTRGRTPDEDPDLLEHLADAGDRVRGVTDAVGGIDCATGKDERPSGEAARAGPAEHADLDAAVDVTEQRNRAGGDGSGSGSLGHPRMVWARWPSATPPCIAKLWPPMSSHLDVALELADIADAITLARFRAPDLRVDTKSDSTPVTDADRTTEQALREALQRLRPGQEIVGEEFGGEGGAEWRWILDPIDGTVNYANGVPVWATLIALMRGDRAVCGVVSAPALGRRWWAATGQGAFTDSRERIHVSRTPTLEDAYVSCTDVRDFATRRGERGFRTVLERARVIRAFGDFWSHMLVAEGVIDVALEAWVNPWDVAATQVIMIEAGGRVSDFDGAVSIDSGNVITTNGLLHDELVALMSDPPEVAIRD